MKTIKYEVPAGSKISRKFYCPVIKKEIGLTEEITEQSMMFTSLELSSVDSGLNFTYFRFIVSPEIMLPKKYDIHYSVGAEHINIIKGGK